MQRSLVRSAIVAGLACAACMLSTAHAQFVVGSGQVTGSVNGSGMNTQTMNTLTQYFGATNATWVVSETSGTGTTSGGLCDGDGDADCTEAGEVSAAEGSVVFNASVTGNRNSQRIYRITGTTSIQFDTSGTYAGNLAFSLTLSNIIVNIDGPDPAPVEMTSGVIRSVPGGVSYPSGSLVPPGQYQLPPFGLGCSANADGTVQSPSFAWQLIVGPAKPCCQPWDNGRFDLSAAQLSQISANQEDWRLIRQYAADDMFLCEGQVHRIDTIVGRLTTNSVVPKALVIVFSDCNGRPDEIVAVAGLEGTRFEDQFEDDLISGTITLAETGENFDGLRIIEVTADFEKLWLKGGAHWVSIVGFSAALNPLDEFFWGHSGQGIIKGRPGVFASEEDGLWIDSDELCCGCTDYNFCAIGESCKILLDNGPPLTQPGIEVPFPGIASLQNGANTQTASRAADKLVIPPCVRFDPCYIEGWMWTNCERVALQIFRDDCRCPDDEFPGSALRNADCVIGTGLIVDDFTGVPVELKKVLFFFPVETEINTLLGVVGGGGLSGRNLWLSLVGLGENRQNARAYFALAHPCDNRCPSFGPGCFRPAPFAQTRWRSNGVEGTSLPGFDHSFLVAQRERQVIQLPATENPCPADINRNGELTVQDIFDFLVAWFSGCP